MGPMSKKQRIRDVFEQINQLPWNYVVYLPAGPPALDTECIVLDPDDIGPNHEAPVDAVDLGFEEGLGIDDIRSIKENAQFQGKKPTEIEMLQAFAYYLENDAFIKFE